MNPADPISLVLLPGLDGTGLLFKPLTDVLPSAFRPIVVRYPVDRMLEYDALADEVAGHLPTSSPFLL